MDAPGPRSVLEFDDDLDRDERAAAAAAAGAAAAAVVVELGGQPAGHEVGGERVTVVAAG